MTSKRSLTIKMRILSASILFLATLTVVIAFAAASPASGYTPAICEVFGAACN